MQGSILPCLQDNEKTDSLARMAFAKNMEIEEGREPIRSLTYPLISD
jgi:hypothetical protein